ncbi:MAG: hypothetical protein AB7I48_09045, partial [Planctomycetaceae bacterium]
MRLRRPFTPNRLIRCLLPFGVAASLVPMAHHGAHSGEPVESPSAAHIDSGQVERLVEQLGAVSYDRRERAADQLQRIGAEALPSLRRASEHRDLEVRYRARQLYEAIERVEQQRILAEFHSGGNRDLGRLLPGWERFAECVGHDASARELFVAMYRSEPEIMRLTDRTSTELRSAVEERVLQFRGSKPQSRTSRMSPATAAVLLFAALDPNLDVNGTVHEIMIVVFGQRAIQEALTEAGDSALRRLTSRWIADAQDVPPSQRVAVAVLYGLETGVVPSLEMIHSPLRGNQIHNAVFSVAKLGGPQHLIDLAALLEDDAVMSERENNTGTDLSWQIRDTARQLAEFTATWPADVPAANGSSQPHVTFSAQVRDVALAAMIHLIGQDPQDYGFTELRPHKEYLYAPNTAGFDSDERRDRALRQWALWSRVQQLNSLDI